MRLELGARAMSPDWRHHDTGGMAGAGGVAGGAGGQRCTRAAARGGRPLARFIPGERPGAAAAAAAKAAKAIGAEALAAKAGAAVHGAADGAGGGRWRPSKSSCYLWQTAQEVRLEISCVQCCT